MSKIKIAHVLHSIGGVDIYLRLVLENMDANKFEHIIIQGTADNNTPYVHSDNTPVKSYRLPIFRNISPLNDIKAILQTCKILKREKPSVIHAHSAKGGVIGRIAGRITGIPVLYTPHAFSFLSTSNPLKRRIFMALEKALANGNSTLLSTSPSENERGIKEVGYKPQNTILFNNSVNPVTDVQPLTIPKTWPDSYICTVGRPSYQKNIELMLQAINIVRKDIPNIHLVLLGVGIVQDRIGSVLELIDTLDLRRNVTMIEWTERSNVLNILSNTDFYISTSRYEGLPYSVIESLALGKPCVVSNCDGNRDLIKDGYNGFVINNEEPELYAQRIKELYANKALHTQFAGNAYKEYLQHYNLQTNIKALEDIYRSRAI